MPGHTYDSTTAAGLARIVPLRTGGIGTPLFCITGAMFEEMAVALPEGQPVYGIDINMASLEDAERQFTVERVAILCLDVIREVQCRGPYYFCGYSFGGLVAYEMATRLTEEGDSANLVALLDAPNPALISNLSQIDSAQFQRTYVIDRLKKYGRYLLRFEIKAFARRGRDFIVSRFTRFCMPAIKAMFRKLKRPLPEMFRANDPDILKAWHSYSPKRYPVSVVLFKVQDRGPEYDLDPSMGWGACAAGGVEIHVVPGSHVDMMRMPSVRVIAEKLATYLDSGRDQSGPTPEPFKIP